MITYLLQTLLFQLLFLLVYEFLLKKETFFAANRYYLLLTALASLLLPFAQIEALNFFAAEENFMAITNVWLPDIFIGTPPETIQSLPAVELGQDSTQLNWWLLGYGAGFICFLSLLFTKFSNLRKLFRYPVIRREKAFSIIEVPDSRLACTFNRTIFLGDRLSEAERQQILPHELVHVRQKHSLDLLFFELLKLLFCFNPLVHIYQRRIAIVHEFQADAVVVKQLPRPGYYQQLLNHAFHTQNISFINQFFNHSLIQKRIVMLQKTRSHANAQFKYLVLLPLILLMLTYVSCSTEEEKPQASAGTEISDQLDALQLSLEEGQQLTAEDHQKLAQIVRMITQKQGNSKTTELGMSPEENPIPFTLVETPPVFADCPETSSYDEKKQCFINTLTDIVAKEFDTSIGKSLGLEGMNKIYVLFKIDGQGQVYGVEARGPHPALEAEGIRVVENLPEIIPATHEGKPVNVIYSLPIAFNID